MLDNQHLPFGFCTHADIPSSTAKGMSELRALMPGGVCSFITLISRVLALNLERASGQ